MTVVDCLDVEMWEPAAVFIWFSGDADDRLRRDVISNCNGRLCCEVCKNDMHGMMVEFYDNSTSPPAFFWSVVVDPNDDAGCCCGYGSSGRDIYIDSEMKILLSFIEICSSQKRISIFKPAAV